MAAFKSLQTRLRAFLILPVALFLLGTGLFGYIYIRQALLREWQETAILKLERAAHQLDMRLQLTAQWMDAFAQAGKDPHGKEIQVWILKQLREQDGVAQVKLTWGEPGPGTGATAAAGKPAYQRVAKISPPRYSYPPGERVVGLESDLLDAKGKSLGKLEVLIKFDYLMKDILTSGWMSSYMACLVDVGSGQYLAHTDPQMAGRHCLGETQDPLELAMLKAMKEKPSDTVLGGGYTPEHVIGFYRLHAAPWALMLHAQGSQVLAPILRFRFYYLISGIICLAAILLLIRLGVNPVVSAIRQIARRAALVAQGRYGEPLPVESRDEIGQLTESFNEMVAGLKERDFISNTFGRYVDQEIARELLRRPEAGRLGGEKRQVVILFSDIRDFTPLAETLSPEATISLVNGYFSRMIEIIHRHRGIIVDFLGDAILVFFDPLDGPLGPALQNALKCALEMQGAMAEVNASGALLGLPTLKMGIGLHTGEVVVGNIGSEDRAKYGIVGAAVNLTHRLQAEAKGGEVVLSETVFAQLPENLAIKRKFSAHLKGVQEPMTLYVVKSN
ncbi:MAG: adenylate/guanylate cyclase domain-containing protein [Thermodesulfobacteriota bacterium]